MDSRVFWGVLCALLVFSGLVAVATAVQQRLAAQAQAEAIRQVLSIAANPDPMGLRRESARRAAEAQRKAALDLQRRRLAPSERCIGGTVVQVSGSTYTQASGPDGRPVACSGLYRLK